MIDTISNILVTNNNNDLINSNEKSDKISISRNTNDEQNYLKLNNNSDDIAGNYYRAINDTTQFSSLAKQNNNDDINNRKKDEPINDKELTKEEKAEVKELKSRDTEVKTHEQAHISAGASNAQYEYKTGPDGIKYATGGHAEIDTSKADNPHATLRKAQQIKKAALAPANPSSQDRKVAAEAETMANEAQQEIRNENLEENKELTTNNNNKENTNINDNEKNPSIPKLSNEQNLMKSYGSTRLQSAFIGHNFNSSI